MTTHNADYQQRSRDLRVVGFQPGKSVCRGAVGDIRNRAVASGPLMAAFQETILHSIKRLGRSILLAGLTMGLMASAAHAQQLMQGRIWDFSSSHPDFETGKGGVVMPGQVEQQLGPDGKPVWAGPSNEVFSSKENFDQWYRDVPGVNMSKPYALELVETPAGSGS